MARRRFSFRSPLPGVFLFCALLAEAVFPFALGHAASDRRQSRSSRRAPAVAAEPVGTWTPAGFLASSVTAAPAQADAAEAAALGAYFQGQGYTAIPLRRGTGNHLEVTAKINDRTGVFLLDTGAQISVVNRSSLGKFNLSSVKTGVKVFGALGGPGESIGAALASSIQLGPCTVSPFLVGVSELNTLNQGRKGRFDGIIGADLLQNFSFIIDCRTPRLFAKDARSASDGVAHLSAMLRGRNYVEVPMKKVAISDFEINANVNRLKALLLVDTGAAITLIDRELSRAAGINFRPTDFIVGGAGGGKQRIAVGTVKNFNLNGLKVRQAQIAISDISSLGTQLSEKGKPPLDGYLGADFLRQKSALIDCAGLKLYLKN